MRRNNEIAQVPFRSRPSAERAAAAARLAGVAAGVEEVSARMRQAARRSRTVSAPSAAISGAAALAVAPVRRPVPPREEPGRPRHLRVVPDGLSPAQRRRRARALLVAGIVAAGMIGLALVYFHVVLAQRQFAIDRLQANVQKAQATYQDRRLEVARLGSPQHIISTAEGELGMVQPSKITYITPASGAPVSSGQTGKQPLGQTPSATVLTPSQAPVGDADWPSIKSQLAGIP